MQNKKKSYDIWSDSSFENNKKLKSAPGSNPTRPVVIPHPGQSYHPEVNEHKKLLNNVKKIDNIDKAAEKLLKKSLSRKISPKLLEEMRDEEMMQGMFEDNSGTIIVPTQVKFESCKNVSKKSKSRRQLLHQDRQKKTMEEKMQRIRDENFAKHLKVLKREKSNLIVDMPDLKPKNEKSVLKYGPARFYEPKPEVEKDVSRIAIPLRRLVPQGDLIQDCFKSIQRRGLVETRNIVKKCKSQTKPASRMAIENTYKQVKLDLGVKW